MNIQELKKLETRIKELIKQSLDKNAKIILGLSGGADSIFLLNILKELKYPLIAVHLNHNLRGRQSIKDEKFVQDFCTKENIKLITESIDIKLLSKTKKEGFEERGRKERYKLFEKIRKQKKFTHIALAHHANDNIETILGNLIRGGSLQSQKGMEVLKNKIFRPLIFTTKSEILDYLKTKHIPYRNDKSNKNKKFKRNFIRLKLIPLIKKINPNFIKTFTNNALLTHETIEFIEQKAKKWINKYEVSKNKFNAKAFRTTHIALQKVILRKIYENLINDTYNIESKHINEIIDLINKNIGNKEKKLGKTIFSLKSNFFIIKKSVK